MDRRKFLTNTVLISAATALASSTASAERLFGREIVTLPARISESGVYVINRDFQVRMAEGIAIEILADDVTLEMNGHSITNSAVVATRAIGVEVRSAGSRLIGRPASRVAIKDGKLSGFYVGIRSGAQLCLEGPTMLEIDQMECAKMRAAGILVSADNAKVTRCRVLDIGDLTLGHGSLGVGSYASNGLIDGCQVVVAPRSSLLRQPRVGIFHAGLCRNSSVINCEVGLKYNNARYPDDGDPSNGYDNQGNHVAGALVRFI